MFFISFIINIFVVFYTVYLFFEMKVFHQEQGSKLSLKELSNKIGGVYKD